MLEVGENFVVLNMVQNVPANNVFKKFTWCSVVECSATVLVLVLVYTQEGSLWSIVLRCDDHTGIFTCDGCARDPYFYVPAETQSYVIKLSCSRKVLAASGD